MKNKAAWAAMLGAFALAACAPQSQVSVAPPMAPPEQTFGAALSVPQLPYQSALPAAIEAYKARVATEIWTSNADVYADPVPQMLKSIVVLEISVDRAGNPIGISVYRSNGYKHLETRALESVVRAAPFPAPDAAVLEGPGCVTFLETFLFRDDERFQLRSLVF